MNGSKLKTLVVGSAVGSLLVVLGACGTGMTPGGMPLPGGQQVKADTAFDRTGTLRSDGAHTSMTAINFVSAGDEGDTNLGQRAIVSVVLNQVPAGANVSKAVLRVRRFISEGNPYNDFGAMTVDHVNVVSSINAGSFFGSTLTSTISTINPQAGMFTDPIMEIDVTAQVKADLAAGRPISSFRFQFNNGPSLDNAFDQVFMYADQNDETLRPTATITIDP